MEWPLILAGPILRRVEPELVSVWVALSEKRTVRLSVWQGSLTTGPGTEMFINAPPHLFSGEAETLRIGDKLHITVVSGKAGQSLRLMSVVGTEDLDTKGHSVVIVALVGNDLHIRIFDASGGVVIDKPENELISGQELTSLKELLSSNPFPDESSLSLEEKQEIIASAASIADHNLPPSNPLLPDSIYSYNLTFDDSADLKSLKLLQDSPTGDDNPPHLALGYQSNLLPSFATCPLELTDLQLVHGSCRRINQDMEDGLAWVDDLIEPKLSNPFSRPHQLLLSGDQIYADDVSLPLLPQLIEVGNELLKKSEFLPLVVPGKSEITFHSADKIHFPPGLRHRLVDSDARFTSSGKHSHLLSFGEYAALYLMSWSNVLWDIDKLQDFDVAMAEIAGNPELPPLWKNLFRKRQKAGSNGEENVATEDSLKALFKDADELLDALKKAEGTRDPLDLNNLKSVQVINSLPTEERERFENIYNFAVGLNPEDLFKLRSLVEEMQGMFGGLYRKVKNDERKKKAERFYKSLSKVRRALANVPTYMMFDDHEVTDDWYLNPIWRDRVMTAPLGKTVLRNGLLSYALFQGWGNDPERFNGGHYAQLLKRSNELFPAEGSTSIPNDESEPAKAIDKLLGLDGEDPPIKWHYSVQGSRHKLLALDNRTRRSFVSRIGPPGNISMPALEDQIPAVPSGDDVLVVIAPIPVLGVPVFDELIGPLAFRAFDLLGHEKVDDMPGTNPDAIEGWAYDAVSFEALLKRLEPYRRVVLLSGDVHFGACQEMSYWKKNTPSPARFAQFVSSGLRNVMPSYIRAASQSLAFAQKILQLNIGTERLGWDLHLPEPLLLAPDAKVAPVLRSKLRSFPVLIPSHGWPDDTEIVRPPDWTWRVKPVRDERPDDLRPVATHPELLEGDLGADFIDGYRRTAVRHVKQLDKMNHSRQIVFAYNLGLVTFFEKPGGQLCTKQELYAVTDEADEGEEAEVYTIHEVALDIAEDAEDEPTIGDGA